MAKYCIECLEFRENHEFRKQHNRADGLSVRCLECIRKGKPNRTSPKLETPTSKTCKRCNRELDISHFRRGHSLDGHIGVCRDCVAKPVRKRHHGKFVKSIITEKGRVMSIREAKKGGKI